MGRRPVLRHSRWPLALALSAALLAGCSQPQSLPSTPASSATPVVQPAVVAPAIKSAAATTPACKPSLATSLAALPRVGTAGYVVVDGSGAVCAANRADDLMIPASAMKLLTATVALDALGPAHRFTTRLVSGQLGQVILVGGGDPYWTAKPDDAFGQRASVPQLADQAATALKSRGLASVSLGYDDTLFTGPTWNQGWLASYRDQVSPTSALSVYEGGTHSADPSRSAASTFAAALRERGIAVSLIGPYAAPRGAENLAQVTSLPLESIVEQMLLYSDNDAAEVLFRHAAVVDGGSGSLAEAQVAVPRRAASLGLWRDGMRVVDGSGLARDNRTTPAILAKVIANGIANDKFRSVVTGLPTAGGTGTLTSRFDDPDSALGRGLIRAKTGTLIGVHALVGYVHPVSGGLLSFSLVLNDAGSESAARNWLDAAAALLATGGS